MCKVCDPCSSWLYAADMRKDNDRPDSYASRYYHRVVQDFLSPHLTPEQEAEEKYLNAIFTRHLRNMR